MLPKIRISSKQASNKSYSKFNFVQIERICVYLLLECGASSLERLVWLKYYILLKWQVTFNLGLNTNKTTESNFQLQNIIIFKTYQSLKPPSPTWGGGGINICVHWVFCRECISKQLLLEAFFHIISISFLILVWWDQSKSHFRKS